MCRILFGAALAILGLSVQAGHAQQKLETKGYGSLSGKVTLVGAIPAEVSLVPLMMKSPDEKCCLDPKAKAIEKIDQRWIVDKKTKGVANVVVWVKPPAGSYFEIHKDYLKRKDKVIIDQPHCAYVPYVSAYQPVYFDGKDMVATGQELIFKNSATVTHNVQGVGDSKNNEGFNPNMPPKTELNATKVFKGKKEEIKPQLMPILLACGQHPWMAGKLYVFDHPYYAITKTDGTFEIPFVPAGAEIRLMVHHAEAGWVLNKEGEFKKGRAITLKAGQKMTIDLQITP